MVIVRVNRKFKDSLFRVIFSEKKELLELYNAINGSHYENPGDRCPFRFRSSSCFTTGHGTAGPHTAAAVRFVLPAEGVPCLECTATMININYGHNEEMMKSCRKLYEYAFLINAVRSRLNEGLHLEAAVDQAVEDCIQHDVLKNFLLKHREEVREMILSEYDEELHINSEKKISYEEGLEAGVVQGTQHGQERVNALITRLAAAGRADDIIRSAEDSAYQEQLFQEFGI